MFSQGRLRILRKAYRIVSNNNNSILKLILPKPERKFLSFVIRNRDISNSQIFQDLLPLYIFQNNLETKSYFVEVGANDGITFSNTLLLEEKYGWDGLLIEPNQKLAEVINIRKCKWAPFAVGEKNNEIKKFFASTNSLLSSTSHKSRSFVTEYEVISHTLTKILKINNVPQNIDFMTIDIEGDELEAIRNLDLNYYQIKIICVEHNYDRIKEALIDDHMKSYGYVRILRVASQFDAFYVKNEYIKN